MRSLSLRLSLPSLAALAVSGVALAQGLTLPAEVAAPLEGELRRTADDVPDEGTPEPAEHYPVSNEWRHDLWFPHLRDRGGAFVGVGTDQCYTLAAVQNASMVWLVDFDPLVPLVHRMYSVLVPRSATPAELVARFDEAHEAQTAALLEESFADDPGRRRILGLFRRDRARISAYLTRAARLAEGGQPSSWLSSPELYGRVRALFAGGRIVARNGDVTGARTLRAVGDAARRLGVPVRAVYFSNAEQFFPYSASFLANVRGLPTDERTVLLRTYRGAHATYPRGDRWHYVVHPWPDFLDRLEHGYRRSQQIVNDLTGGRRPVQGAGGLTVIDAQTPRRSVR